MRIGTLARRAGVSASKVRFYEARGLLRPPARAANGYRSFDEATLKDLLTIRRAQSLGFTLEQIGGFLSLPPAEQAAKSGVVEAAEARLAELDLHLAEVHAQRRQVVEFLGEMRARRARAAR